MDTLIVEFESVCTLCNSAQLEIFQTGFFVPRKIKAYSPYCRHVAIDVHDIEVRHSTVTLSFAGFQLCIILIDSLCECINSQNLNELKLKIESKKQFVSLLGCGALNLAVCTTYLCGLISVTFSTYATC